MSGGGQHDQSCCLPAAPLALKADVARATAADDLRRAQRIGGGAVRALDAQRAAEADEIGGRADVLVGHSRAVARREQKVNIFAKFAMLTHCVSVLRRSCSGSESQRGIMRC